MASFADTAVFTDFRGLAELKAQTRTEGKASLKEVARQFESLFLQMMMKSMRQTSLGDGLMDSDKTLFYRDLYDQQLALHLSGERGLGLAAVIQRDLGGDPATVGKSNGKIIPDYFMRPTEVAVETTKVDKNDRELDKVSPNRSIESEGEPTESTPAENFVRRLWPWAREAASMLGLEPAALLAQAALETGWGRKVARSADGTSSHNLFGIKADDRWQGNRVSVPTVEFEQGLAVRRKAAFRSYESFRESFRDYVGFLRSSPRYQKALAVADDSNAFFHRLQEAGYATDPHYAEKIKRVLESREMTGAIARFKNDGTQSL